MFPKNPPRRTGARGPNALHAARDFVAPYQLKLNGWHGEVAGLQARQERKIDIHPSIERIYPLVVASRIEFERGAGDLSLDVGDHSVVRDVRHSLQRLADDLMELSAA